VISGQPLSAINGVADVLKIALALYSVVVSAALAGSLGAYFVEHQREVAGVESGQRAS
jgi:voltage-gated potassium channel